METPQAPGLGTRLMVALAAWCDRAGGVIIFAGFVLCVASVLVTVRGLGFNTDRNDLIGTDESYRKTYDTFRKEFPQEDDIVVVVTGPDAATNRKVVDRLGALLRQDPVHFSDVYDHLSLDFIRQRLLLYLSVDDLRAMEKRLKDFKPFLRRLMGNPGIVPLFGSINDEAQAAIKREINRALEGGDLDEGRRDDSDVSDMVGSLPILAGIMKDMAACVQGGFRYRSPWASMFAASRGNPAMEEIPQDIYLEFQDGAMYLVLFKPVKNPPGPPPAEDFLAALRRIVDQVRGEFPRSVKMGMTGEPVLENDEMEASSDDSSRASIVSLVFIALLFAFTFGNIGRPMMGMISLVLAMGWTMGFTTLAIGHLNILTVTCMPMLIGLGIDFGIQVISRYDEELVKLDPERKVTPSGVRVVTDPRAAMEAALVGTGLSIITAAVTTAVSFGAAWFTGFRGVGELGLLAGGGLMLSLVAMIVVLPAMLLLADRRQLKRAGFVRVRPNPLAGLARVEGSLLRRPVAVLLLGIVVTAACAFQARKVTFDYNLLNLQTQGIESVEWEKRLINGAAREVLFAAVVAHDVEQARALEKRLAKLPTVKSVESVAPMFPEDQEEKLRIIPGIQRALADVPPLKEPLPPVEAARLSRIMEDLRGIFFLIYPEVRQAGEPVIASHVRHFIFYADQLIGRVRSLAPAQAMQRLYKYQHDFFHDLGDKLALIRGQGPVAPLTLETMPPLLRRTRMGLKGSFLLQVFPKDQIWDQEPLKRFLDDIDRVAPANRPDYAGARFAYSTGTPVMMYNSSRLLVQSYIDAGWYAFGAIVVCVLLHFRSLLASLLALVPLGIGMIWMEGMQGLFQVPFNPANYMVLPLILGIGVANGIYVVRRFQEEGHASVFEVSTGRAILLSNLTAMIGFGSLMIAKYQGIYSLGKVMTLGIGTCMTAALVLLPVVLQLLARLKVRV